MHGRLRVGGVQRGWRGDIRKRQLEQPVREAAEELHVVVVLVKDDGCLAGEVAQGVHEGLLFLLGGRYLGHHVEDGAVQAALKLRPRHGGLFLGLLQEVQQEGVHLHGRLVVGPLPELVHQLGAEQDHPVQRVGDMEPGYRVLLEQNQDILVSRGQVLGDACHEHALVGVLQLGGGVLGVGGEDVLQDGAAGRGLVLLGECGGGHAVYGYASEEPHHGEDGKVVALQEVDVGLLLRVLGPVRGRHHNVLGRRRNCCKKMYAGIT